jgi:hypothetical protein
MTSVQIAWFVVGLLGSILMGGMGFFLGRMIGFRKGRHCAYEEYSAMIRGLEQGIPYGEIHRRLDEIYQKRVV